MVQTLRPTLSGDFPRFAPGSPIFFWPDEPLWTVCCNVLRNVRIELPMRRILLPLMLLIALSALAFQSAGVTPPDNAAAQTNPNETKPGILVELFTSEGCSSCPPADELLRKLDSQATQGDRQIVVLGEHVDYWDRTGWRDRFSSHEYTDRQEEYARRFHTSGPYTPQIVVDGERELVGNDARLLQTTLRELSAQAKANLRITAEILNHDELRVKLDTGPLPGSAKHADLYVAVADNSDETQVGGGENSGRRLRHVAVLRSLQRVAKVEQQGAQQEFRIRLPKSDRTGNMRLIAFLQESNNGAVLGATMKSLD